MTIERQRSEEIKKVDFKFQFDRELWQKAKSWTQERYSRLEKEGDRKRGIQGLKEKEGR